MFSTYKVPTTVLKIGVKIGERFKLCLLSVQSKAFVQTACSTVLVFFKTEQKYLN